MNIASFLTAIQAAEQLIPAVAAFANTVHPAADAAPTRAQTALAMIEAVFASIGIAAQTYETVKPTITASIGTLTQATPAPTSPAPAVQQPTTAG